MPSLTRRVLRRQPLAEALSDSCPSIDEAGGLKKCLGLTEVIAFGLSCTVGSGIFVTAGIIAHGYSGPALFVSMMIAILGSLVTALCYAELASKIPAAGQAYSYCYVALGEIWGFTSGWLSTVPYTISSAAVARGWANYMGSFIAAATGYKLPSWVVGTENIGGIVSFSALAPILCVMCTVICLAGVKESATFSVIMTVLNVCLVVLFSFYGSIEYADAQNLQPLTLPDHGLLGVFRGVGLAFFCCVGWDGVCTLSEEVRNPQKDIPRGLIGTLAGVAILYILMSLTLCAMVPAYLIDVKAPIASAFELHGDRVGFLLASLAAITVCTPSVLCGVVGQPRIWYRMAVDGLLFERFCSLSANDIPVFGTVVCGSMASVLAVILDFEPLASTTSFATLLMLLLVCVGSLSLRFEENHGPVIDGKRSVKTALGLFCVTSLALHYALLSDMTGFTSYTMCGFLALINAGTLINILVIWSSPKSFAEHGESVIFGEQSQSLADGLLQHAYGTLDSVSTAASSLAPGVFNDKKTGFKCPWMPYLPLLACWVNSYMMASLGWGAFVGTSLWMVIGLLVYFSYSIKNSRLNI